MKLLLAGVKTSTSSFAPEMETDFDVGSQDNPNRGKKGEGIICGAKPAKNDVLLKRATGSEQML